MRGYWTFKDYVAADGVNEIHAWLNNLPERAKAKINWRISQLEQTSHLTRPATGKLHDDCEGFFELRVEVGNVQYRPICCHGPGDRDVTILFGAIEKGRKFVPLSACLIARRNSGHISERGRVCGLRQISDKAASEQASALVTWRRWLAACRRNQCPVPAVPRP